MTVRVEVLGLNKALGDIRNYQLSKVVGVRKIVQESGINIQRNAKRNCPVDTGRLRSSIRTRTMNNGLSAEVGTDVRYGPFVESGTRRMPAQPFLFPAGEQERPNYLAGIRRELGRI